MGAAALPLALAGMGGTSLLQFAQTREAGKIQEIEAKTMAKHEELAVVQREADRKEALARAMASQNAAAGAKNIAAFEGSPLTILQADIEAERVATERDITQSQIAQLATRARGTIAKRQASLMSAVNLIGDTSQLAYRYAQSR